MRLYPIAALSALATTAAAFRDTSPFVLLSTYPLHRSADPEPQLTTATELLKHVAHRLSSCPSRTYIIASLHGVSASDFSPDISPYLYKALEAASDDEAMTVRDVVGEVSSEALERVVRERRYGLAWQELRDGALPNKTAPGQHKQKRRVVTVDLGSVTGEGQLEREQGVRRADQYLYEVLDAVGADWTLLLRTTSRAEARAAAAAASPQLVEQGEDLYEMDEPAFEGMRAAWKRDLNAYPQREKGERSADVALFEKYQFLSSGVFMGVAVSLLLLLILYVGLSAVSGLEVSYMAFAKEMNPSQQKKQQQ